MAIVWRQIITPRHLCQHRQSVCDLILEKKADEHIKGLHKQLQLLSLSINESDSSSSMDTVETAEEEKAAVSVSHLLRAGMIGVLYIVRIATFLFYILYNDFIGPRSQFIK